MNDAKERPRVRHVTVSRDRDGQRLDNFLMSELGRVPRGLVYRLVRTGQVRVDGRRAKPMRKLREGQEIRIPPIAESPGQGAKPPREAVERLRRCIVERNEEFIVLDKPAGIAVQGGSGLAWSLLDALAEIVGSAVHPVHRLDRPTSGLLVVALNPKAARELQKAFAEHRVDKRYLAIVQGDFAEDRVRVDAALKKVRDGSGQHRVIVDPSGQAAVTDFKVLEHLDDATFVEARIETGRTHQIRVHAASIGHPLLGDDRYNQDSASGGRLFLHAHYLKLPWPEGRIFSAPLPEAFTARLDSPQDGEPDTAP